MVCFHFSAIESTFFLVVCFVLPFALCIQTDYFLQCHYDKVMNFSMAENYCVNWYNGHLSSLHSNADVMSLADLRNGHDEGVWFGLWDPNDNGVYEYTDGSQVNYTHWGNNQEAGNGQQCAIATVSQQWDDRFCYHTFGCLTCNSPLKFALNESLYDSETDTDYGFRMEYDDYFWRIYNITMTLCDMSDALSGDRVYIGLIGDRYDQNYAIASDDYNYSLLNEDAYWIEYQGFYGENGTYTIYPNISRNIGDISKLIFVIKETDATLALESIIVDGNGVNVGSGSCFYGDGACEYIIFDVGQNRASGAGGSSCPFGGNFDNNDTYYLQNHSIPDQQTDTLTTTRYPSTEPTSIKNSPTVTQNTIHTTPNSSIILRVVTDDDDDEEGPVDSVELAVELVATCIFAIFMILLCCVKIVYACMKKYRGVDTPDFGSLFQFSHRIFDLFTDILVCYSIYLTNKFENNDKYINYVYASIVFVLLPLLVSIFITFYHIYFEWNPNANTNIRIFKKQNTNINNNKLDLHRERITNYLDKYKYVLIIIAMISCDFYSAVNLIQSKLFCLQVFNLQLTLSEQQSLAIYKFLNQTLCENIPQMVISLLFLSHNNDIRHNYSTRQFMLILTSLVFSIVSILSQIVLFLVSLNNILVEYNNHVTHITKFNVKMVLHCSNFKYPQHEFIHYQIKRVLWNSFLISNEISELMNRGDIRLKHNVYYINNSKLKKHKKLTVYFQVHVACYNDIKYEIRDKIENTLKELGNNSSKFYQNTINGIKILLKLKKSNKLKIVRNEFNLSMNTIKAGYNNGALLQLSVWYGRVADKMDAYSSFVTSGGHTDILSMNNTPGENINTLPEQPQTNIGAVNSTAGDPASPSQGSQLQPVCGESDEIDEVDEVDDGKSTPILSAPALTNGNESDRDPVLQIEGHKQRQQLQIAIVTETTE